MSKKVSKKIIKEDVEEVDVESIPSGTINGESTKVKSNDKEVKEFWKNHKKKILVGAAMFSGLVGIAALCFRNRDSGYDEFEPDIIDANNEIIDSNENE